MRRISFIVYPGYSVMALAAVSVFETANQLSQSAKYELQFISEQGGPVKTSSGMQLHTDKLGQQSGDTLVVGGGDLPKELPRQTIDFISTSPQHYRRVIAICTGAFLLAEAGLLDGRQATTHWHDARNLRNQYAQVKVDDDKIFIQDGQIWTSAGMTAGIDLCLQLLEDDQGAEFAKAVARKLVVYHRRGGGQSQFSSLLEMSPESDRIQKVITYVRENLNKPLAVEELAEVAHLSTRQFSRSFHTETGMTPAKAVENIRVETARSLLDESHHSIEQVARQTGFSDRNHMRRAFLRRFGQTPQSLKRTARAD